MKKQFMLKYVYDDGSHDEYFVQAHNVTIARQELMKLLEHGQKPIGLFENVKNEGWIEKALIGA